MPITTATKIIRSALGKIGVAGAGKRVSGGDLTLCADALRVMVASMRLGPSFAYHQTETVATVAAVASVTLGPGATIDMVRPARIERGSFTRVGGLDYPLTPVDRVEYNRIAQKSVGASWPEVCHWDGGSPTGALYLAPIAAAELHLMTRDAVGNFVDVTSEHDLPEGLEEVLVYSLAERVAPDFEVEVRADVAATAKQLRRAWQRSNHTVSQLEVGGKRRDPQSDFIAGRPA